VAELGLRLAAALVNADAAAMVRWRDGRAELIAGSGDVGDALTGRPAEGASRAGRTSVASVSVDPRTDLIVTRAAPMAFNAEDLEALRAIAGLIKARGGGSWRETVLRGFSARVVASLDIDQVLAGIPDTVSQLLRAEMAGVFLREDNCLQMRAMAGNTHPETGRLRIQAGHGLAGRVLLSGSVERLDDYSTDPRSAPELMAQSDLEGTCSAIAVPLSWEGQVEGVVVAWRRRREPFTDEDASLFEALGELCSAAIHNALRHGALHDRAGQLAAENDTLHRRVTEAERDLRSHTELTAMAGDGDVEAVLHTVARLTGSNAVLITDDGRVLGTCADPTELMAELGRSDPPPHEDDTARIVVRDDGSHLVRARVRAVGLTFGYLVLFLPAEPGPGDLRAAEHAAMVTALLLAREDAAVTAAGRVESEFVWDLLEGRLTDSLEARARARRLGTSFSWPVRVVSITVHGLAYDTTARDYHPEHLERLRGACARLITGALGTAGAPGSILARRGDVFAAIVPVRRHPSTARGVADGIAAIAWPAGTTAEVGVSGAAGSLADLPVAWRQAQLARSAAPAGRAAVFEELGVLQFLLAPTGREDLDNFARRELGPLLDYDAKRGTELTRTLERHLEGGCSLRATAELMCIHHRTVSYRLARITELTGLQLNDQEDRFRAQLACKILGLGQ
jgi:putative methionine-R-sulfoxide reductase with GAF domain